MSDELTRKEQLFVEHYVATGEKYKSALNAYDINSDDKVKVASVIASENLEKPRIKKAIAERLPDSLLEEKHKKLLEKTNQVEKVDPETGEKEIVEEIDERAVKYGLDMAYKLKGSYAPERRVNVNADAQEMLTDEQRKRLDELIHNESG